MIPKDRSLDPLLPWVMLDKGVDSNACPVVLSAFLWSDVAVTFTHTPSALTRRHHTIASTQASAKP